MSRKPGLVKTGGRKKGTPNKRTFILQQILDEKGLDPIDGLIDSIRELENLVVYETADKIHTLKVKIDIYLELLSYLYPKRKAIQADVETSLSFVDFIEKLGNKKNEGSENEEGDQSL